MCSKIKTKLRTLSGDEVVAIFEKLGFSISRTKGSHVVLRRVLDTGKQTLVIPRHRHIKVGMLQTIYRQALQYISEQELRKHFYT